MNWEGRRFESCYDRQDVLERVDVDVVGNKGPVAQLVERRVEGASVGGSIPSWTTQK